MKNHPPARMAGALGLGLAALVLSGCTGSGEDPPVTSTTSVTPTASVPTSSTTSATPTTSATSTGIPDAAKQRTNAGAEAFVRYFIDEQDRSWLLPDDQILPPLFDPACSVCITVQKAAEQLVEQQQTVSSDPTTVDDVRTVGSSPNGETVVRMTGTQNAITVRDSDGRTITSVPRKDLAWSFHVRWTNGWRVTDLLQAPA